MLHNKKKLTACVLTAILGLSYAVYPVHAQETGVSQQSDTDELLKLDKTAVPVEENKAPQITPELDTQEQAESKSEKKEITNKPVETGNEVPTEFTEQTTEKAEPQGQISQDTVNPSEVEATNGETYSEQKQAPKPEIEVLEVTSISIKLKIKNECDDYGNVGFRIGSGEYAVKPKGDLLLEDLTPNTSYRISVRFNGDFYAGYTQSEVATVTLTTQPPTYTISIPSGKLEAGNVQSNIKISVDESKPFGLGYGDKVNVKIKNDENVTSDAKLKLKHESTSDEITSALLVNGTVLGDINKNVSTFTKYDRTPVSISFAKPTEIDVPQGTYQGKMVFEISYSKGNY